LNPEKACLILFSNRLPNLGKERDWPNELRALELAKTVQPELQKGFVSILEMKLSDS